jgi:SnoaL-like domain
MSNRNVELTRGFVAAFNARDIEAMIAYCDSSVELHSALAVGGEFVYREHDHLRSWQRELEEAWGDEIRADPEAYFDLGESTLCFYTLHGRGRHSGAEVTTPVAGVARWRDGLMVYWKTYVDRHEALAELGVAEDELEPIAP